MTIVSHLAEAERVQQLSLSRARLPDWVEDAGNRIAGAFLLIALSPLLALIALAIWRTDGAPLTYGHYRVGHRGRVFKCLKFRTMLRDAEGVLSDLLRTNPAARAEWERDQKLANDPRVTGIGALLRRTSLDELPQLLNVVRGDMVLVGPRPITVQELTRYGRVRWHYLAVKPGMTGLWQVSGRNKTTYEERVELDRTYVESRSFQLNLRILFRTVKVVALRDGAV